MPRSRTIALMLDTSVLLHTPALDTAAFKALRKYCIIGLIDLHIHFVAEREYLTTIDQEITRELTRISD